MLEIIIYCLITTILFYAAGSLFVEKILNIKSTNTKNPIIFVIYGFIFLSFVSLILNFFVPLSKNVNSLFSIILIAYFFNQYLKNRYSYKIYYYFLIITFFSSLILIFSEANRPDSGLYHFPYIKILNDSKIIIGLSNIHFRFGHISIIQYLNAFNFNHLFGPNGILIPQSIAVVSTICYFFKEFTIELKKNKHPQLIFYLFFSFIFCIYNYNRYGSFGNDAITNIFFILTIYEFLKCHKIETAKINSFFHLFLISSFTFLLKPFMITVFLFPLFLFFNNKIKIRSIINNKKFYIISLFLLSYIIKNILISGCLIYPMNLTCLNSLKWANEERTIQQELSGEAWSKDWSNIDQKNLVKQKDFINDFKWLKIWSKNHLRVVLKKIFPFIIFLVLFILYIRLHSKSEPTQNILATRKNLLFALLVCIVSTLLWFLKFPIYRYGSGILGASIIVSSTVYLESKNISKLQPKILKTFLYFMILIIGLVSIKNIKRITNNFDNKYLEYPWPKMYSFSKNNEKLKYSKIFKEDKLLFYINRDSLCMYGPSPCTYYYDKNIDLKIVNNYKLYYIKK